MKISDMYRAIAPIQPQGLEKPTARTAPDPLAGADFANLLHQQVSEAADSERGFKLSSHAQTRIRSREIPWGPELEQRVKTGLDSVQAKGSREALILAGDVAVIANIPTRTVITAMDSNSLKERVFTNIDSAILV